MNVPKVLALGISFMIAPAVADVVELPLAVAPGDRYSVVTTTEVNRNGRINGLTATAQLSVLEVNDVDFLASWSFSSFEVDGQKIDMHPSMPESMLTGIPVEYVADVDGQPLRVSNRDSLLASLKDTLEVAEADRNKVQPAFNFLAELPDEMLAAIVLRTPTKMSLCQSLSLETGAPNVYASQVPNPFGDGYGGATVSYELLSLDDRTANIEYKLEVDPESAEQFLRSVAAQTTASGDAGEWELDKMSMVRADTANCDVDVATGWVTRMEFRSEVTVRTGTESQTKIETNSITVQKLANQSNR